MKHKIIEDIKLKGISGSDLEKAKTYLIEQNNIQNLNLMKKAHNIAWFDAICGDYALFEKFNDNINNITNEDIIRVVNKYFTNYCEVIATPKDPES